MATKNTASDKWKHRYGSYALVTGASDGIGKAMAQELAERGLNVILVARNKAKLDDLSKDLEARFNISTRVIATDLSQQFASQVLFSETRELDVGLLVAAAGFGTSGTVLETRMEDELNMIDLNCRSVFELTKHFAEIFRQKNRGGIVLFSSLVAFQGVPNAANYAATKAYNQTLAEGLRKELRPFGVDVLACAPGPVASGFAERSGLVMGATVDPQTVARETLKALGRQTTVRPGLLSKILIGSLAILPRFGRTAIMGLIMGGMVKKSNEQKAA
jgi:short-subunit dehydrogenase